MLKNRDFLGRKARPIRKDSNKSNDLDNVEINNFDEEIQKLIENESIEEKSEVKNVEEKLTEEKPRKKRKPRRKKEIKEKTKKEIKEKINLVENNQKEIDYSMLQGAESALITLLNGAKLMTQGYIFLNNKPVVITNKDAIKQLLIDGNFSVKLLK